MTWRIALQLALSGLSVGSIYAIVALSLAIPFKASRVLNFAQGELVTLGAYIALVLSSYGLPYPVMVPATLVIAAVFGLLIERLFIRPIVGAPEFTLVIATFALGLIIRALIRIHWQDNVFFLPAPYAGPALAVGPLRVNPSLSGHHRQHRRAGRPCWSCSFSSTRLGKAMRAVSFNQTAARLMGISVGTGVRFGLGVVGSNRRGRRIAAGAGDRHQSRTRASHRQGAGGGGDRRLRQSRRRRVRRTSARRAGDLCRRDVRRRAQGDHSLRHSDRFSAGAAAGSCGARRRFASSRRCASPIAAIAIVASVRSALPLFGSSYQIYLAELILINIVAAIGLNLLTGNCGQISLCHASLMAIGAYTTALLTTRLAVTYALALPAGVVVTTLLGASLGYPARRLSGLYLALVTLGFLEVVSIAIEEFPDLTGGVRGLKLAKPELAGWPLSDNALYLFRARRDGARHPRRMEYSTFALWPRLRCGSAKRDRGAGARHPARRAPSSWRFPSRPHSLASPADYSRPWSASSIRPSSTSRRRCARSPSSLSAVSARLRARSSARSS